MRLLNYSQNLKNILIEKITFLINIGYQEVYLITYHGFVLTGLLEEADKIDPNATGKKEVHERFIRTVDKQSNNNWLEFERPNGEYKYVMLQKVIVRSNQKEFMVFLMEGFTHRK